MKRKRKIVASLALGCALVASMGALAGTALAGTGSVSDDTDWTVPTAAMTNTVQINNTNYKVITTWANAWALSGPDYLGVSNSGTLNQQGGGGSTATLDAAQHDTLLGIWASEANEVPNAYNWNYFWNLYCESDAGVAAEAEKADFEAAEVSNSATANWINGVYAPLKYRPEIIWTSNSFRVSPCATYVSLIRQNKYYSDSDTTVDYSTLTQYGVDTATDDEYNPYVIGPNSTSPLGFVESFYKLAEYSADVIEDTASNTGTDTAWTAMNKLPRTTRYEASSENALSAEDCALNIEKIQRGAVYYVLSKIADGTVEKKKVAFLTGDPDSDGDTATVAVFDFVEQIGMGATGGRAGVSPLTVDQLDSDTVVTHAGENNSSSGGSVDVTDTTIASDNSVSYTTQSYYSDVPYTTYTVTADELAGCDIIFDCNGSDTTDTLKAWVQDNVTTSTLKTAADSIEYMTTSPAIMNAHNFTSEKLIWGAYDIDFFYPELFPNMELTTYWYDNVYHLTSDSLESALTWALANASLPSSFSAFGTDYSTSDMDKKFLEGYNYYAEQVSNMTDETIKRILSNEELYADQDQAVNFSAFKPSSVYKEWAAAQNSATNIANGSISLSQSSYTYDGTAHEPTPTVTLSDTTLTLNTDYTVTYTNNTNAGTATVTATGSGSYLGSISTTFTIAKATQKVTTKKATWKYKAKKLKKAKKSFSIGAKASGKGKLTYKLSSGKKKFIKISSAGKVTIKKGAKKGTYKIKVSAKATTNYLSATKVITIKIA